MANLFEALRDRLPRVVSRGELTRIQDTVKGLMEAYVAGPFELPPEQLVSQLREYDAALLSDMVEQLYWEQLGTGYSINMARQRQRTMDESRRLWYYSVLYQWSIWMWTNYGFGENVMITAKDAQPEGKVEETNNLKYGDEVFREFWEAGRNQPVLAADKVHELSNWLLVEGNQFLCYYASTLDGETTVRRIAPTQIIEIVTAPDDPSVAWFYKRQWITPKGENQQWYYPSWEIYFADDLEQKASAVLPKHAKRADQQESKIADRSAPTCLQHLAYNRKEENSLWGWPLSMAAAPWLREHKKFREHRASVAASRALYTDKLKVKGGSRAVKSSQARVQSSFATGATRETNPPAASGSLWIENPATLLERLSQKTDAGDAKEDGNALAWMGLIGLGMYPHYAGIGDVLRWATAGVMEGPMLRQWSRYQLFWSAQFRIMVRIVLQFREKFGGMKFSTYEAEVSTDRLVEADLEAITNAVGRFYETVLVPLIDSGVIGTDLAKAVTMRMLRIMLQALGVADADELVSDEAFEKERSEESAFDLSDLSPKEQAAILEAAARIVQRG